MPRNDWKSMAFSLQREVTTLRRERLLLAQLAADTPQFFNPLTAYEAQAVRDRVLAEFGSSVLVSPQAASAESEITR